MATVIDYVTDADDARIRKALNSALRGSATAPVIAARAKIGKSHIARFIRGARIRKLDAVRLCEVLAIPPPGVEVQDGVDPVWAAARPYAPEELVVQLDGRIVRATVVRRGEVVRTFTGASVEAVCLEMGRCAS